jgi:hypothetical protein
MRQIRTSGSMRERWRRGVGEILGHRQPKGPATGKASLRYRATSLLYRMASNYRRAIMVMPVDFRLGIGA